MITGMTDNAGNEVVLTKLMTSKFPLVVILTEMASQLKEKNMDLNLEWVPRGQNEAADALTNGNFQGFDPSLRVNVVVKDLPFRILPEMMRVADDLYAKVREAKSEKEGLTKNEKIAKKIKPEERLRARDPW